MATISLLRAPENDGQEVFSLEAQDQLRRPRHQNRFPAHVRQQGPVLAADQVIDLPGGRLLPVVLVDLAKQARSSNPRYF
jgi:hypothetical protein